MTVATSTCHICLEELDFDLRYLKKKCCPTEAFICNECWEKVMNSDTIVQCPLCRERVKTESIVPVSAINTNIVVRDIESQHVLIRRRHLTRIQKVKKFMKWYFLSTITGFSMIMMIVYYLHPKSTTFEREVKFLIVRPFFWFMCAVYGWFMFCILDILFGRVLINRMIGYRGS